MAVKQNNKAMGIFAASLLGIAVVGFTTNTTHRDERDYGQVIQVRMVDVSPTEYRFEPAEITAHAGDTVRFEQAGAMPHNVQFKVVPEGTNLGSAMMGPFLTSAGQTYDVVIDSRFAAGEHGFVCTPHEGLGMVGTLTVAN